IEFVFSTPKDKTRTEPQAHLRYKKPKDLTPDEQKEIVALLKAAHQSMRKYRPHLRHRIHVQESAINSVSRRLDAMREGEQGIAGPISRGQFAWDGKQTQSLTGLQRNLLEVLWDQGSNRPSDGVSQADVVKAVYGEKANPRDRRVQKKLQNLRARCQKVLD